jgi:Flp pilus assembly pilin Flp
MAIGARYNNGAGANAGHVRVFKNVLGEWTQIGSDIDGEAAGDESGYSVSLSSDGTIVAIGAFNNDGTGADAGHVRVFKYDDDKWTQIGSDIDGEAAEDYSGFSVSLSSDGTIVAIGASYNDGTGSYAGHVRIFKYDGDKWTQIGSDIDGEAAFDESGFSVSLSSDGTIVAIGAIYNDGTGIDAGHVRVFKYVSGVWTQIGSDIDGEAEGDRSGESVSLSSDGTIVAIGARNNDGTGFSAGHVRVFNYDGDKWTQIGSDIDGEAAFDDSGYSVSLSSDGTILAIGARSNAGYVRVFKNVSGVWTQIGSDIDGEAEGDYSGFSVSLSSDGTIVAIGAIANDENGFYAGHVRVFKYDGDKWTQNTSSVYNTGPETTVYNTTSDIVYNTGPGTTVYNSLYDIDGEAAGDESGYSVSLSSDGTIMAIGAIKNDGTGSNSGHVRVFKNVSGEWTQIGSDIDGEAEGDYSGISVSLSSDGTIVAIGANLNNGTGADAGHVRVFKNVDKVWTQIGSDIDGEAEGD